MKSNIQDGNTFPCNELLHRHPSLKPLARDHGAELICVQRMQKAIAASGTDRAILRTQIRSLCQQVISSYLQDEHRTLSAVIPPDLIEDYNHRFNRGSSSGG